MEGTLRIHTKDGEEWEIRAYMSHRIKRAIDAETKTAALVSFKEISASGLNLEELQTYASKAPDGNRSILDSPEEEDSMLLLCTVSWSYNEPITHETMGNRPENVIREVLAEMRRVYSMDEETIKN